MDVIEKIGRYKRLIADAERKKAKEQGILEERCKNLQELCGTDDVKVATHKLMELADEVKKMENTLEKDVEKFRKEFADVLNA